jgi:hypothetical protein
VGSSAGGIHQAPDLNDFLRACFRKAKETGDHGYTKTTGEQERKSFHGLTLPFFVR